MEEKAFEKKEIGKIEKVESLEQKPKVDATTFIETEEIAPSKSKFDIAVSRANEAKEQVPTTTKTEGTLLSPIHEMSMGQTKLEPVTFEKINDTTLAIQDKITSSTNALQNDLQRYPDIKITPAAEMALQEKLVHTDSTLRSALKLAGAEATSLTPPTAKAGVNPLVNFLSYLTHSDKQMKSLMKETARLGEDPKVTPGKLIAIQIKLNFVQQEIEFFSSALNKALESAKTIMNVQI